MTPQVTPYVSGDLVAVLFNPFAGDPCWIPAVVLSCEAPVGIRAGRFQCRVAIGHNVVSPFEVSRIYCWADGNGEGIKPLEQPSELAQSQLVAL